MGGTILWFANDGSLIWFIPALLIPDVSMVGYVANSRIGAIAYNAVHNLTIAGVALGLGWWLDSRYVLLVGAVLLAHVGMDRTLGYGLKYPTGFQDTHLGRIGGSKARNGRKTG